jgi:hypothetical protein
MAIDLREMIKNALQEFSRNIEKYAGEKIHREIVRNGEDLPEVMEPSQGALDYKDALERLEKLTDKQTFQKIMGGCGCTCQSIFDQHALKAKEMRQKYATEEEFLEVFHRFDNGTIIERKGKDLLQHFQPGKMFPHLPELRCACPLLGGLPKGVFAPPSACECSRAFTKQRWEIILGRPVEVELVDTPIISDTKECQFIIRL